MIESSLISTDPFTRLPLSLIDQIIPHLDPRDVIRLQRVSRQWRMLLGSEYIHMLALRAHFPSSPEARDVYNLHRSGKEPYPTSSVSGYRQAVFRSYARKLGKPTRYCYFRTTLRSRPSKIPAWNVGDGYLVWAEDTKVMVQRMRDEAGGRRVVDVKKDCEQHVIGIESLNVEQGMLRVWTGHVGMSILCYALDDLSLKWQHQVNFSCHHFNDVCYSKLIFPRNSSTSLSTLNYLTLAAANKPSSLTVTLQLTVLSLATGTIIRVVPLEIYRNVTELTFPQCYQSDPSGTKLLLIHSPQRSGGLSAPVSPYQMRLYDTTDGSLLHTYSLSRYHPPAFQTNWRETAPSDFEFSFSHITPSVVITESLNIKPSFSDDLDHPKMYERMIHYSSWRVFLDSSRKVETTRIESYVRRSEYLEPGDVSSSPTRQERYLPDERSAVIRYNTYDGCRNSKIDTVLYSTIGESDNYLRLFHNHAIHARQTIPPPDASNSNLHLRNASTARALPWGGLHGCPERRGQVLNWEAERKGKTWMLNEFDDASGRGGEGFYVDERWVVMLYRNTHLSNGRKVGFWVLDFGKDGLL